MRVLVGLRHFTISFLILFSSLPLLSCSVQRTSIQKKPSEHQIQQASQVESSSSPAGQVGEQLVTAPSESKPQTRRFPDTLNDFVHLALENSSGLKAAFDTYQAALKRSPQATALPDPMFNYGYFLRSVETRVGPQRHRLGIAQSFPWFGTLSLRGEMADAEARAEFYRFLTLKNKLVFDVTQTYAQLIYLHDAVAITKATISLVQSWEEVLRERFRAGTGSHSDLVRVQVELGKLEDRIREFEDLIRPMEVAFNALLNRNSGESVSIPMGELTSKDIGKEVAAAGSLDINDIAQSPALKTVDALIEARVAGIQLAEKKYFPDLTFGIDYIAVGDREGQSDGGKDAIMTMVSMNLPLYWEKNRAREDEARLSKKSVEEQRVDRENMLRAEFARAQFELRDAERKIRLFERTLIPKAEESIEASYTAYESGESGFLDVLDSERRLLDFRLSLSRSQSDRAGAVAKLFMIVGDYNELGQETGAKAK